MNAPQAGLSASRHVLRKSESAIMAMKGPPRTRRCGSRFDNRPSRKYLRPAGPWSRTNLRIGPVDDPLEREADRIADAVVSDRPVGSISGLPSATAQRKCSDCDREDETTLQRKSADAAAQAVSTSGSPLSPQERAYFEPRFGRDLSGVRLHTHTHAAEAARALNARAYAFGRDIAFAPGEYGRDNPGTRRLVAHELAHVVQQGQGNPRQIQRTLSVEKPSDNIPNPGGKGATQTNADTAQQYLNILCGAGKPTVTATGDVSLEFGLCAPFLFGFFGNLPSPASLSATPTGCNCLCDIVNSGNAWTILIDDVDWPHTDFDDNSAANDPTSGGTGGRVTAPSPNSPKFWGAATAKGNDLNIDPWLVLGHELCGHAWMGNKGGHAVDTTQKRGRGGHQATVERENLIRQEHGIEARGTFKDPNCGESFWRDNAKPADGQFFRLPCRVQALETGIQQEKQDLVHPEPLTTRIGERPMSRQTAMPGSGYRHNRQPRPQPQMDLFGSGLSNGAIGAPAWPELPAEAAGGPDEPDDAVDPRPCCDDSDAAREGGRS